MDDFQDANHKRPQTSSSGREQDGPSNSTEAETEAAVQSLQQGLDALDGLFPASRPSSAWFDQQIAAVQKKQRSRLFGDLLKLWGAALLLLYLLFMVAAAQPVTFITFQALAILAPLAWLLLRKQVDSHET
jgi:cobalamin biosynthesis protein CobD/CbiB